MLFFLKHKNLYQPTYQTRPPSGYYCTGVCNAGHLRIFFLLKFNCIGHFKLEFKHKKFGFFKLIECIIKKKICHGVKQYAKICAIG